MFVPDIPGDKVPEGRSSQVANWLLYEKAGRWARVCLAGGGSVQGIILPRAELGALLCESSTSGEGRCSPSGFTTQVCRLAKR